MGVDDVDSICKDCGEKMTLVNMPQPIFTIPFTKGRFVVWDWHKKERFCNQCAIDKQEQSARDTYDDMMDSVARQAYKEGYDDGRHA